MKLGKAILNQVENAKDIFARGWTPMPVYYREKRPVLDAWPKMERKRSKLKKHFGRERRNIGLITGPRRNGPIDIDIDGADVYAILAHFLPATSCKFGREGKAPTHYLYSADIEKTRQFSDPMDTDEPRAMLIEMRANNAFSVCPGSIHENGDKVVWMEDGDPAEVDPDELSLAVRKAAACALLARHFPGVGTRHKCLLALTGFLTNAGWAADAVEEFANLIADHNGFSERSIPAMVSGAADKHESQPMAGIPSLKEYWPDKVIDSAVKWLGGGKAGKERSNSESSLAYGFIDKSIEQLRYVTDRKKWLHHDGKLWRYDGQGKVKGLVRAYLDSINFGQDPVLGSNHKITSVLELSSIDTRVVIDSKTVDANPDLLGTPDGIIDLKAAAYASASAGALVTKSTAVAPNFELDCPTWLNFLHDFTEGSARLRRFLQRWAGYCCTGHVNEQVLLILLGEGQNGKTVFQRTIANILGDYSCVPSDNLFITAAKDPAPIDIAHIEACRLIEAAEPEPGRTWNEGTLKRVTGGDKLYSRRHYVEGVDIAPTGKLLIAANQIPAPKTIDFAMRRRFLIAEIKFRPKAVDDRLLDKLKDEYPAILAWMIKGAKLWYKRELDPPDALFQARDKYFDSHDWLAKWIAQRTKPSPESFVANRDSIMSFNAFMRSEGQREWDPAVFGAALSKKGYKPKSRWIGKTKTRGHCGFRLAVS